MACQDLPRELVQTLLSAQAIAALNEMRATEGSKAGPAPVRSPVRGIAEEAPAMAVPGGAVVLADSMVEVEALAAERVTKGQDDLSVCRCSRLACTRQHDIPDAWRKERCLEMQ